jgi:hypothetical protein
VTGVQTCALPICLVAAAGLLTALNQVEATLGIVPTVYTSPGYWSEFGTDAPQFARFSLWIAHYLVAAPKVPRPWSTWDFWQYTSNGHGPTFGAESLDVDLNWYNGTVDDLYREFAIGQQPPPPIPTGQQWRVRATVNIRTAPTQSATITGRLQPGEIITASAYTAAEGYTWAQHERGWSAMYQGGFMEAA